MDLLCRTCMRSLPNLLPLFEDDHLQIKIETLTSIKITKDDRRFPSKICGECIDSINKFYNFRIIIINNDLDFRIRYLASRKQTINNEDIANAEEDCESIASENDSQTSENCETLIDVNEIDEPDIKEWDNSIYDNIIKSENSEVTVDEEEQTDGDVNIKQEINDCNETQPPNGFVPIKCTECDFKASDSEEMLHHKIKSRCRKIVCDVCGKSIRMGNMTKHMKIHNVEEDCESIANENDSQTSENCETFIDVNEIDEPDIKEWDNSIYDNIIKSENFEVTVDEEEQTDGDVNIKQEINDCNETQPPNGFVPIECTECGFKASDSKKMLRHKNKSRCRKLVCNVCGKSIRMGYMAKHMKIHTEDKVTCPKCGKQSKNSSCLKVHLLGHTAIPTSCEICGKSYKSRADYKLHLKNHTEGVKKSVCSICNKEYLTRSMKRHMRRHTGERPHLCKYCDKGFTTNYTLIKHMRTHSNEKPYTCEHCSVSYREKISLTRHLATKH